MTKEISQNLNSREIKSIIHDVEISDMTMCILVMFANERGFITKATAASALGIDGHRFNAWRLEMTRAGAEIAMKLQGARGSTK